MELYTYPAFIWLLVGMIPVCWSHVYVILRNLFHEQAVNNKYIDDV